MSSFTIGVDLGGTNIRVALVDESGTILREVEERTEAEKGSDYVIGKMTRMICEIKGNVEVLGIGIGAPGPLDPFTGIILSPPNLPGWTEVPLVEKVKNATGLPVTLDNDANAAALAEAKWGAGADCSSVFYITVSTGIGGGFVIDGELFQGAQGYSGEIGNMIVSPNGKTHSNLNPGALEALASGTAISREGKTRLGVSGGAEEVFLLADKGNRIAQAIIDEALNYLAIGIANLSHAINPEIFVLGGGVMKSEQQVLQPLRGKVKNFLYPGLQDCMKIERAALHTKAGVIGAACLVRFK